MNEKKKRVRHKEYLCVYPGCNEGLKTKYNCLSHIWDVHIRSLNNITVAYKDVKNKQAATQQCLCYLKFIENAQTNRKRRPYDYSDLNVPTENPQECYSSNDMMTNELINNTTINQTLTNEIQTPTYQLPQISLQMTPENEKYKVLDSRNLNINSNEITCSVSYSNTLNQIPSIQTPNIYQPIEQIQQFNQKELQEQIQTQQLQTITLNPLIYELITTCNTDFVQTYVINQNIKRLHVFGEIFAENGFIQRSDSRYKHQIKPIQNALTTLLQITGRSYYYLSDNKKRYGFIAQELQCIIPEAVTEDSNGELGIDVISLIPFIIESFKELQQQLSLIQIEFKQQCNGILRIEKVLNSVVIEVNSPPKSYDISLGPPSFTLPISIISGIAAIFIAFNGSFPVVWLYLIMVCSCHYISTIITSKNQTTFNSFKHYLMNSNSMILLNYTLCCCGIITLAITLLIGNILQIFLATFFIIAIVGGIWSYHSFNYQRILIVLFVILSGIIACLILFWYKVPFSCEINTPMIQDTNSPSFLHYTKLSDVKFDLASSIPWNCFDPKLLVDGKRIQFENGESVLSAIAKEGTVTTDTVDVKLICSSIQYKCNEYSISGVEE